MVFLDALESMASITLLVLVGYVITRKGLLSAATEEFLPKFLIDIVIPPYMFATVCAHFRRDQLFSLMAGCLVPLASMALCHLLFTVIARLCNVDRRHRALFAICATLSNTIVIGIPVNTALFGEQSLPYLLVYFFANTTYFWTVGVYVISREGCDRTRRVTLLQAVRRVFSKPLLGILCGVAFVALDLRLPKVFADTFGYLGGVSTPLALIYVGATLCHTDWKTAHIGKDLLLCLAGRMVASPLIIAGILLFVDLPRLMEEVFTLQAGLPAMANIPIYASYFKADKEFGSFFVTASTLTGMLSIPVWMTVITCLF